MLGFRCRLLFALLLFAAPALAEPVPGGEVHVERSDRAFDCPNEAELVKAALALGTAPSASGTTPISIAVRFDRDPSSYLATVSASGQKTGERELSTDDSDCKRLADSVAVVLAVLLDLVPPEAAASFETPASAEPAPQPARPPEPSPLIPAPAAVTTPAPVPAARPEPGPPFVASFRAEGALAYGLLGGAVSPYVGGAAAFGRGPVAVALGGDWVVPRTAQSERLTSTRVHLGLAYGFADGCLRTFESAAVGWEGSVCARFAAGVFSSDGRGFDHHFPRRDAWFAAGPVAVLRFRLTHALALRLDALGLIALGHQTLVIPNYGAAYRSSPLSGGLALGPELSIW